MTRGASTGSVVLAAGRGAAAGVAASGASLAALGPPALAVAAALGTVAAAAYTFKKGLEAATDAAQFNARVATAQQAASFRSTVGRMRAANQIDGELSSAVSAGSHVSEELRELKTILLRQFLPPVTVAAEIAGDVLSVLNALLEGIQMMDDFADELGAKMISGMLRAVGVPPETAKRVAEVITDPLAAYLKAKQAERVNEAAEIAKELNEFLDPHKAMARMRGLGV